MYLSRSATRPFLAYTVQCLVQFDYIYWSGDLIDHQAQHVTREGVTEQLQLLGSLFQQYFPGTPVYSSLGNHDSAPVNLYANCTYPSLAFELPKMSHTVPRQRSSYSQSDVPDNYKMDWLYGPLTEVWNQQENIETIMK